MDFFKKLKNELSKYIKYNYRIIKTLNSPRKIHSLENIDICSKNNEI